MSGPFVRRYSGQSLIKSKSDIPRIVSELLRVHGRKILRPLALLCKNGEVEYKRCCFGSLRDYEANWISQIAEFYRKAVRDYLYLNYPEIDVSEDYQPKYAKSELVDFSFVAESELEEESGSVLEEESDDWLIEESGEVPSEFLDGSVLREEEEEKEDLPSLILPIPLVGDKHVTFRDTIESFKDDVEVEVQPGEDFVFQIDTNVPVFDNVSRNNPIGLTRKKISIGGNNNLPKSTSSSLRASDEVEEFTPSSTYRNDANISRPIRIRPSLEEATRVYSGYLKNEEETYGTREGFPIKSSTSSIFDFNTIGSSISFMISQFDEFEDKWLFVVMSTIIQTWRSKRKVLDFICALTSIVAVIPSKYLSEVRSLIDKMMAPLESKGEDYIVLEDGELTNGLVNDFAVLFKEVFSFVFNISPDCRAISYMKCLKEFSLKIGAGVAIAVAFCHLFESLRRVYREYCDGKTLYELCFTSRARTWEDKARVAISSVEKYRNKRDANFDRIGCLSNLKELISEGNLLVIDKRFTVLIPLLERLRSCVSVVSPPRDLNRVAPCGIILFGQSGIGKTDAVDNLVRVVNARRGYEDCNQLVGNYNLGRKFQDNFDLQCLTVCLNDALQTKDEYVEQGTLAILQSLVDTVPFCVNMADLMDKEKSKINHDCVILTTNTAHFPLTKGKGGTKLNRRYKVAKCELNILNPMVVNNLLKVDGKLEQYMSCPDIPLIEKDNSVIIQVYDMCSSDDCLHMEPGPDSKIETFQSWSQFIIWFDRYYNSLMDAREESMRNRSEVPHCKHHLIPSVCPVCPSLVEEAGDETRIKEKPDWTPFEVLCLACKNYGFLCAVATKEVKRYLGGQAGWDRFLIFAGLVSCSLIQYVSFGLGITGLSLIQLMRTYDRVISENELRITAFLNMIVFFTVGLFGNFLLLILANKPETWYLRFLKGKAVVNHQVQKVKVLKKFVSGSYERKLKFLAAVSFIFIGYQMFMKGKEEDELKPESKVHGEPVNLSPDKSSPRPIYVATRNANSWSQDPSPAVITIREVNGFAHMTDYGKGLFVTVGHVFKNATTGTEIEISYLGRKSVIPYRSDFVWLDPEVDLAFVYVPTQVSAKEAVIYEDVKPGDLIRTGESEVKIHKIIGEECVMYEGIIYDKGDCGKKYHVGSGIVGIHRGRSSIIESGVIQLVSKKRVDCARAMLHKSTRVINKVIHESAVYKQFIEPKLTPGLHERSDAAWMERTGETIPMRVLGHLPSKTVFNLSGEQTDLAPFVEGPEKERPNGGKAKEGPDGVYRSIDTERLRGYSKSDAPKYEIVDRLLDYVVFPELNQEKNLGFVSMDQALAGDINCRYANARECEKAAGPWLKNMRVPNQDVVKNVEIDGIPHYQVHPELERRRDEFHDILKKGELQGQYYVSSIKDEMIGKGKAIQGKGRYFLVGDYHSVMLTGEACINIHSYFLDNKKDFNCFADINTHDWSEWEFLYDYITFGRTSKKLFDFDYSKMDVTHGTINEKYYEMCDLMASACGYSPEEMLVLMGLLQSLDLGKIQLASNVYEDCNSLPSGRKDTLIKNSMINMLVMRYCCLRFYFLKFGRFPDPREFLGWIRVATCGDDVLVNVRGPLDEMCGEDFRIGAAELGFKLTSTVKDSPIIERRDISEVTFLKRRFVPLDGRISSPLALDSILGAIRYQVGTKPSLAHQRTQDTINSQCLELFQHGEEIYNRVRGQVLSAKVEVPYSFPEFEESKMRFMRGVRAPMPEHEVRALA